MYVGRVAGDGRLDRTVLALGAQTGHVQWQRALDPPSATEANVEGPPVVANGRIYLRVTSGGEGDALRAPVYGLVSLDRATGGDVQRVSTNAGFDLPPIDGDSMNFGVSTAPVVANDVLYVGADSDAFGVESDSLHAIEASTGTIIATLDLPITGDPVVVEGSVYVTSDGTLYAIEEPTTEE